MYTSFGRSHPKVNQAGIGVLGRLALQGVGVDVAAVSINDRQRVAFARETAGLRTLRKHVVGINDVTELLRKVLGRSMLTSRGCANKFRAIAGRTVLVLGQVR